MFYLRPLCVLECVGDVFCINLFILFYFLLLCVPFCSLPHLVNLKELKVCHVWVTVFVLYHVLKWTALKYFQATCQKQQGHKGWMPWPWDEYPLLHFWAIKFACFLFILILCFLSLLFFSKTIFIYIQLNFFHRCSAWQIRKSTKIHLQAAEIKLLILLSSD